VSGEKTGGTRPKSPKLVSKKSSKELLISEAPSAVFSQPTVKGQPQKGTSTKKKRPEGQWVLKGLEFAKRGWSTGSKKGKAPPSRASRTSSRVQKRSSSGCKRTKNHNQEAKRKQRPPRVSTSINRGDPRGTGFSWARAERVPSNCGVLTMPRAADQG